MLGLYNLPNYWESLESQNGYERRYNFFRRKVKNENAVDLETVLESWAAGKLWSQDFCKGVKELDREQAISSYPFILYLLKRGLIHIINSKYKVELRHLKEKKKICLETCWLGF